MVDGPAAGLALLDALDASGDLAGYHLLPAAQADFCAAWGGYGEAAAKLPAGAPARPGRRRK